MNKEESPTISSLLDLISYVVCDVKVQPVGNISDLASNDLAPLYHNLQDQIKVHDTHTEPQYHLQSRFAKPKKSHAECRLGPDLADEGATRRNVDHNAHPMIPTVLYIAGRIFHADEDVVHEQDQLCNGVSGLRAPSGERARDDQWDGWHIPMMR